MKVEQIDSANSVRRAGNKRQLTMISIKRNDFSAEINAGAGQKQ